MGSRLHDFVVGDNTLRQSFDLKLQRLRGQASGQGYVPHLEFVVEKKRVASLLEVSAC